MSPEARRTGVDRAPVSLPFQVLLEHDQTICCSENFVLLTNKEKQAGVEVTCPIPLSVSTADKRQQAQTVLW